MSDDEAPCACLSRGPHFPDLKQVRHVGVDRMADNQPDITISECTLCHRHWLRSYQCDDGYASSGQWITAPIEKSEGEDLRVEAVSGYFARQPWVLVGGSYAGGGVHRMKGTETSSLTT